MTEDDIERIARRTADIVWERYVDNKKSFEWCAACRNYKGRDYCKGNLDCRYRRNLKWYYLWNVGIK